jgi:DNA invertase Pin-like site-specific DNA recombinase
MFTLPIVCNSLTVALTSTFKRNSLHYWTMKNIRPSLPPIMIATLSSCAQLERDNISFRLQSGRKRYIEKGGKLGRKVGSIKTEEQMKAEYREVISLLRKGYSIRDVAKLSGKGVSTVQRVKRLLKMQSPQ